MKTQPRQHSNKYNTCPVVTSPVYIGSKICTMPYSLGAYICSAYIIHLVIHVFHILPPPPTPSTVRYTDRLWLGPNNTSMVDTLLSIPIFLTGCRENSKEIKMSTAVVTEPSLQPPTLCIHSRNISFLLH